MSLNSSISESGGTSVDLLEQYNFLLKNLHEERDQGKIEPKKIYSA